MILTIFTDGGSLNNPGQAAYGYVIYKEKKMYDSYGEKIGIASNNVAEYTGLIKSLEKVLKLKKENLLLEITGIHIFADSSLMINQIKGLFKVKNVTLRELLLKVQILENEVQLPIKYTHVPREQNQTADSLVKKALGR